MLKTRRPAAPACSGVEISIAVEDCGDDILQPQSEFPINKLIHARLEAAAKLFFENATSR
jgi:hypothetical protein